MWWSIFVSELPIRSWYCILIQCLFYNFGLSYIRTRYDGTVRKWVLTILGFIDLLLVCGIEEFTSVVLFLLVILVLIKITAKKHIRVSALLVFGLMSWHRLYSKVTSAQDPILAIRYMHATLKIVGLGFEMNESYKRRQRLGEKQDPEDFHVDPSFGEAIHYVFSLAGNLGGSYIRYRTYKDTFRLPFSKAATVETYCLRLFQMVIGICLFYYPLSYIEIEGYFLSETFEQSSMFLKIINLTANGLLHCTYVGLTLIVSELINMCSGIGAYPVKCENKSGHGPTKHYSELSKITYEEASEMEIDFKTIASVNFQDVMMSPFLKNFALQWNMTVQYFLAQYFYKQYFRQSSKFLRLLFTEVISLVWHELNLGYSIFFLISWPVYSVLGDPAMKIILNSTSGFVHKFAYACVLILKNTYFYCQFIYLGRILNWPDVKAFSKTSKNIILSLNIFTYSLSIVVLLINRFFGKRKKENNHKQ